MNVNNCWGNTGAAQFPKQKCVKALNKTSPLMTVKRTLRFFLIVLLPCQSMKS